MIFPDKIKTPSGAVFSPDEDYRYALWRTWDTSRPHVLFIGLNPSTADETQDDPTIRRCIGYSQSWGYGGLLMGNLYAFRTTSPAILKKAGLPIGRDNKEWLACLHWNAAKAIAAWGIHGAILGQQIGNLLQPLYCLRLTKDGCPSHPLYLPKSLKPVLYERKQR